MPMQNMGVDRGIAHIAKIHGLTVNTNIHVSPQKYLHTHMYKSVNKEYADIICSVYIHVYIYIYIMPPLHCLHMLYNPYGLRPGCWCSYIMRYETILHDISRWL